MNGPFHFTVVQAFPQLIYYHQNKNSFTSYSQQKILPRTYTILSLSIFQHLYYSLMKKYPSHWILFEAQQPTIQRIYQLLTKGKYILKTINAIETYNQDSQNLNETTLRYLYAVQHEENISAKKQNMTTMLSNLSKHFQQLQIYQIQITKLFCKAMSEEIDSNMEYFNAITTNNNPKTQYGHYIQGQFIQSLLLFNSFIRKQAKVATQYASIIQFYQAGSDTFNYYKQQSSNLANYLAGIINEKQRLANRLSLNYKPQNPNSNLFIFQISFSLMFCTVPSFLYSLVYLQDYKYLSQHQYDWLGSIFCIIYMWINYYLSNYCLKNGINVIIGMNCQSQQEFYFYKQSRYFVIFFLLTFIYIWLFICLYWQHNGNIQYILNSMILAYFLAEITISACVLSIMKVAKYKLSYLHFSTMLIPMSDVLGNLIGIVQDNANRVVILKAVDLVIIMVICGMQVRTTYKEEGQISFYFILLVVGVLLTYLCAFFIQSYSLIFFKLVFKIVIVLFMVSFQYKLAPYAFYQNIKDFFKNCCQKCQKINICLQMQSNSRFPKIKKLIFIVATIIYTLFLAFGVQYYQLNKTHKYIFQTIIILLYLLYNKLYIDQVDVHLRHPFSNFSHLSNDITLVMRQNCINYDMMKLRISENSYNLDDLLERNKLIVKKIAEIQEAQQKMTFIYQQLSSSVAFKMFFNKH